ncbi:RMD1 family protein [Almyronema epifaneia]|uniref:RMD1 family protein n=1 Tax=Almyronema epifaneia S1 TaxID=2991925 RepID=A0ABW6IG65_9CYAN
MQLSLFSETDTLQARALFLGQSLDLEPFSTTNSLATTPLMVKAGDQGCAVLFDYGAVIVIGLSPLEEVNFLAALEALVTAPFAEPETEEITIHLDGAKAGKVENDTLWLAEFDIPSLQIVSDILAKSVVLAHYEMGAAAVFDRIEPFAASLQQLSNNRKQANELLRQIGSTLLIQHKMVGRVEIIDKPELLWEFPDLDRLYLRLEDEYEIRERHLALERKLDLVSRTAETALELQHQNTGLRLEWYVVILIVIEVLLSLYDLFAKRFAF